MKKSSKKDLKLTAGIGKKNVNFIYDEIGLNKRTLHIAIRPKQEAAINYLVKRASFNKTLKIKTKKLTNFFINLKTYKGIRYANKLPVRGQRTHTNAKTVKKLSKSSVLISHANLHEKKKSKK